MPAEKLPSLPPRPVGAVLALCLAAFVVMVDTTVVQVMLPTLITGLDARLDEVLWVVNGFVLVYGTLVIPGARLGDVLGFRRTLIVGLVIFLAGSILCGFAQSIVALIVARLIQAVGGALLVPQTLGLVTEVVPRDRRGMAFGLVSAMMALAAIAGPVLGGLLISALGWRSAFLVNIPLCLLALGLILRLVPAGSALRGRRLDLGGVVLVSASLGAITYALLQGNRYRWGPMAGPVSVPVLFTVGVVLFAVFLWWEWSRPEPLVPIELFGYRSFSISVWLAAAQFVLMFGVMLLVTLHIQSVLGGSPFRTGLVYLPMAVMAGVASPVAGLLTDRWGGRLVISIGYLAFGAGIGWLALLGSATPTTLAFAGPMAVSGLGVGLVMAPASTAAVSQLPARLVAAASGVLNASRQIAGALGVAVIGAALQFSMTSQQAAALTGEPGLGARYLAGFTDGGRESFVAGQRLALGILALIALASLISAQFLPRYQPRDQAQPPSADLAVVSAGDSADHPEPPQGARTR